MANYQLRYEPDGNAYNAVLSAEEFPLYGSSRLGIYSDLENRKTVLPIAAAYQANGINFSRAGWNPDNAQSNAPQTVTDLAGNVCGYKQQLPLVARTLELSNHLGNVLATLTDYKELKSEGAEGEESFAYNLGLSSYQLYYPFGWEMPNLSNKGTYRYGFNGMEKDDESMGGGGSTYDYGFRIYNPQIARFLSVDPLTASTHGTHLISLQGICLYGQLTWMG